MLKRIRALLGGRESKRDGGGGSAEAATPAPVDRLDPTAPSIHRGPEVVHRPIDESDLDPDAVKIVRRLTRFDHTAYLVGGCVRDLLLERSPKDFDIGTSATPRQIKRLFRNCRIIGRRFRLAHIFFQSGKIIEVATFRALDEPDPDAAGDDSRDLLIRDDNEFGTPEEDALRRDFTINALFYDLNDQTVIDHAGGLSDLRRKSIRTIGDPEIRFREDPVRSLRAIKFAARLDFALEPKTLDALHRTRNELQKAAPPRVLEELNRFCREGSARRSFELMKETAILDVVLPEVARGCSRNPSSWSLMIDLLRRMDEQRHGSGKEIRTGEILAVLLVPLVAKAAGWDKQASIEPLHGVNARELADEHLRPLALRLRVPRREQEHCRQILTSILRMVPARRVRAGTRRSIMGRECFEDALWILDAAAGPLGQTVVESVEFWNNASEADTTPKPQLPQGDDDREPRPRRRRSRRGRGGKRRTQAKSEEQAPPRETARDRREDQPKRDAPAPWDDNYFFRALPTAPDEPATPTPETAAVVVETAEPPADEADRPKRRRRPRRRRRKPRQTTANGTAAPPGPVDPTDESTE